jgi:tetratricopeptide (TPR) repeat protein
VQRASGKLEEAIATHKLAVEEAQRISSPALLAAAECELCTDYALSGQWEEAAAHALRVVHGKSDLFVMALGLSRQHITEALIRAGYMQEAQEDLNRWQARIAESPRHRIPYLRAVAALAQAQGETDRAEKALEEAREMGRRLGIMEDYS